MLKKLKQSDAKGFTIIEVMIVLAIAGLILLIVLLAVPALQRNSRNTALKNDAGVIAGAVSTIVANNDGATVTSVSGASGVSTVTIVAGGNTETAKKQSGTTVNDNAAGSPPVAPANVAADTIEVYRGQTCALVKSGRAVAIYYSVELSSGSSTPKCVDA